MNIYDYTSINKIKKMAEYKLIIRTSESHIPNNGTDNSQGDKVNGDSINKAIDAATQKLKDKFLVGVKRCSIELELIEEK